MHDIYIDGKKYTFNWLTDPTNSHAQSVLRRAKEAGEYPECGCSPSRPKMYIPKRGVYILSRMPRSAGIHHKDCLLSRETESNKSGANKSVEAITMDENGISIKLDGALSHQEASSSSTTDSSYTKARVSRNSITLLGMLELLWEQSRFNCWYPNRNYDRKWSTLKKAIEEQAHKHNIMVSGKSLSNILYLPVPYSPNIAKTHESLNTRALESVPQSEQDGFIAIGELKECVDRNGSTIIKLKHAGDKTAFWMHKGLADKVKKSFANEIAALENKDSKIIVIMICYKPANSYSVSSIGLMRVTKEYIPVDSSYEAQIVKKLVDENRKFRKPLRYDSENEVLPDFELLDCENEVVPMEVFGIKDNADYELRKAEKIIIYNKSHGDAGWWQWNAAENEPIPDFPPTKISV